MTVTQAFYAHISDLASRAEGGDELSIKTLAVLALYSEGWRPGDPDPTEPPPSGGGEPIDLTAYRLLRAA